MNEAPNLSSHGGETTTIITKTVSVPPVKKNKRPYTWTPKRAESFKRCQEARNALREQMKQDEKDKDKETDKDKDKDKEMEKKEQDKEKEKELSNSSSSIPTKEKTKKTHKNKKKKRNDN